MAAALSDELIASVLAQYPLRGPRPIELLEASKRNDSYLIEDGAGARYVLRRYRRNPDQRRIAFQLQFQRELLARGFPTSEVIATASGRLAAISAAGPWVLFSYVDGSEYDFANMGQVAEAGRRLAQFHTLTIAIELDEPRLDINFDARRWWTRGEQELGALEEMFGARGIEEEIAFLRAWHAGLLRHWPLDRLDALPKGWVHSDFHGRNMFFAGAELRGLFDFDPLHRGFWAEDLGHALFMFAREFRGSMRIRPDAARLFLDAYAAIRPLSEAERAAISMMAVLAWVPSAPYQELLRRDGEDALASFRHDVALMRALELEMERLAPLLAKTS